MMRKIGQCIGLAAGLLLASCSGREQASEQGVIRVAEAMAHLGELKVSQLGSKIRFVPLETCDSSLVDEEWTLSVTDRYAIVSNMKAGFKKCMTFDLNTGKYIATVGHFGQDPQAYGYPVPLTADSGTEVLYFFKENGLVKYTVDGRFLEEIRTNRPPNFLSVINGTEMTQVIVNSDTGSERGISYLRTSLDGTVKDSVPVVRARQLFSGRRTYSYSNAQIWIEEGLMPHGGQSYFKIKGVRKETGRVEEVKGTSQLWQAGGKLRFHEAFCDTIYTMTAGEHPVSYIFDTGKWRYAVESRGKTELTTSHAFVTDVTESKDKLIFAVSRGWMGDETSKGYIGFYDKTTGITRMGEIADGFRDDLAGFAPFYPVRTNSKGQLIGVLTVGEIDEWLARHRDAARPEFLDTLAEDANPVLVIVE